MRELREKSRLIAALNDARDYTLAAYANLDEQARRFPYARTVNPPLWELAHVAWFQEHWCLRWDAGAPRKPSLLDDADPMLNSALIAHTARWDLPRLTWPTVNDYLRRVLDATIERIEHADETFDPYFPLLSLYHEDMHAEAYRMSLQTLALAAPVFPSPRALPPSISLDRKRVAFARARFRLRQRDAASRGGSGPLRTGDRDRHAGRVSRVHRGRWLLESAVVERAGLEVALGRRDRRPAALAP
jgi:iron(II)-dependent oxidoreductase